MTGPDDAPSRRAWPGPDPFPDVLALARRGDERAFVALWRWLQPALVGWLRVVAPGLADDAAAETWVSVVRGLDGFDGDAGAFRSWVFTIAHRRAVDQVRDGVRAPEPGLDLLDAPEPAPDPSVAVTDADASAAALALLARLPPTQAQVVGLRVVAGLSVREVAEVTGRSEGAVRVLAHRGVRALAALLTPADETPTPH